MEILGVSLTIFMVLRKKNGINPYGCQILANKNTGHTILGTYLRVKYHLLFEPSLIGCSIFYLATFSNLLK